MKLALNRQSADGSYRRKEPLIEHRTFSLFPWGTFAVNISGCFLAGTVVAALVDRHHLPAALRIGLVVGFLAAYTAFSTFAQETVDLAKAHDFGVALVNATASVAAGLGAVVLGTYVGRAL
jgi:fluoride exporter